MNNYRIALMSLAIFLFGGVQAQEQPKTVTFRCVAGPASRVIPALGKAIGIPMSAEGPMGSTVLLIQVKDMPVNDLLARIAKETSGGWEKIAGGYSLVLSGDQSRDDLKAERTERATEIKKSLDRLLGISPSGATDSRPPGPTGMARYANDTSTLLRLLQLIGPLQLADLRMDTRTVYALPANRAQIPLPNGSGQLINKLVNDLMASGAEAPPVGGGRRQSQPPNRTAAKAHLVITRSYGTPGIMAELKIGDSNGQVITMSNVYLQAVPAEPTSSIQAKNPNKTIELSEESKFFAQNLRVSNSRMVGGGMSGTVVFNISGAPGASGADTEKTSKLTSEQKTIVTTSDQRDPLEFVVGESLGKLADLEESNLVACIPDSSLVPAARSINGGKITVAQCFTAMTAKWDLSVESKDGLLMVSPAHPASARAARLNRPSLAKTMLLLSTQGYATLDQRAAYARQQPMVESDQSFERAYLQLVHPGFANSMQSGLLSGERKMLRFYADLSMMQRRALSSGQNISLNNLSAQQKTMVYEMTFGPNTNLAQGQRGGPQRFVMNDMTREATELLPFGVPPSGILSMVSNSSAAVFGIGPNGERVNATTPSFGAIMIQSGGGPIITPNDTNRYDKFQLGKSFYLTFMFQLSPEASFMKQLTDDQIDIKSKELTQAELPDWYRRNAEMQQQMMQRMMERLQQMQQQSPPKP